MFRKAPAVLLTALMLVAPLTVTTQGCGLIAKPVAPPVVTNASNAWAAAKIGYGSTFGVFRSYVLVLCPATPEQLADKTARIECPDTLTDKERKIIRDGQAVHAEALEIMKTGDAMTGGDMTPLIARLNEVISVLNRRAATAP